MKHFVFSIAVSSLVLMAVCGTTQAAYYHHRHHHFWRNGQPTTRLLIVTPPRPVNAVVPGNIVKA
jgi:hypothetical protein